VVSPVELDHFGTGYFDTGHFAVAILAVSQSDFCPRSPYPWRCGAAG
jgi:hypothetical protein